MSLVLPMLLFISLFCCCSLVYVVVHWFVMLCSLVCFVVVHEFGFANAVVH